MVRPAESRQGLNLASTRTADFCRPTCWRVLREPKMRPVLVIVVQVRRHQPFEMPLIQDKSRGPASRVGNFPPSAQRHRSATDCERPCELARSPCPAQPKRHRRQTLRLDRIARICVAVCRPMLLAVAAQSKEHRDFASH